jgi:alkylation response protein AidB-like acyl-CoA dehydrogenase
MTALGRGLLLEPYLPSAILATALIRELGSGAQKQALLPSLAAGERIAVPAHFERGSRYDLSRIATTAVRKGNGFVLSGRKTIVLHAAAADLLLVSTRTAGNAEEEAGISLFAVERGATGVSLQSYPTLDGQRGADVTLRDVQVPREALIGPEGGAFPAISAVWDLGVAAVCAEAVGALEAIFQATVEYLKARKQFDVPIAHFQALQHRVAEMMIHVEQAKSMSYLAAMRCTERDAALRGRAISAAKVLIGQACRRVGQEAVQLHGGMGVTDELIVSHYFKRLTAIELSLGDTEHHLERFTRFT